MKNKEKIDEILVTSKPRILDPVTTVPSVDVSTSEMQPRTSTEMLSPIVVSSTGAISMLAVMVLLLLLLLIYFCRYRKKENVVGKFIPQ